MAQAEQTPTPTPATVSSCAATDCAHNEDRACTAEEIVVTIEGGRPACGSYTSEAPPARP